MTTSPTTEDPIAISISFENYQLKCSKEFRIEPNLIEEHNSSNNSNDLVEYDTDGAQNINLHIATDLEVNNGTNHMLETEAMTKIMPEINLDTDFDTNDGAIAENQFIEPIIQKFALKLDLQEDIDVPYVKTKSILESTDDQLICQFFSQTITSATVTPTDDGQNIYNDFISSIEKEQAIEEQNSKPPSIVVDCYDNEESCEQMIEIEEELELKEVDFASQCFDVDANKINSIYFDITIEEDFIENDANENSNINNISSDNDNDGINGVDENNLNETDSIEADFDDKRDEDEEIIKDETLEGNDEDISLEHIVSGEYSNTYKVEEFEGEDVPICKSFSTCLDPCDAPISDPTEQIKWNNNEMPTSTGETKTCDLDSEVEDNVSVMSGITKFTELIKLNTAKNTKFNLHLKASNISKSSNNIFYYSNLKRSRANIISSSISLNDHDYYNIDIQSLKSLIENKTDRKNTNASSSIREEFIKKCVSVKNLCRSFGDLTSLNDDNGVKSSIINRNNFANNVYDKKTKINQLEGNSCYKRTIWLSQFNMKSSFEKFDSICSQNKIESTAGENLCKTCGKIVFQMEQVKAEGAIWHRNCFRCRTCYKHLNVDSYESHECIVYCRQHFRELFEPKVFIDDADAVELQKEELIISESQPIELPLDVIRSSDKPDLGLDELHRLDVKSKFQIFQNTAAHDDCQEKATNVKRSSSILSKLARFQGSTDELNIIGDDVEKYQTSHDLESIGLVKMNDIKTRFESGQTSSKVEHKEIKPGRVKEIYNPTAENLLQKNSGTAKKYAIDIEICDKTRSLKEKFEKGEIKNECQSTLFSTNEDINVCKVGICRKSRSMFMELQSCNGRLVYSPKSDTKPSIQYSQPNGVKNASKADNDRERDPNMARADEKVDDSDIAEQAHTASKMLSIFRQMEEISENKIQKVLKPHKRILPSSKDNSEIKELENQEYSKTKNKFPKATQFENCAKRLKDQIEKWEMNEIQSTNYSSTPSNDESIIESAKSLCERFESMRFINEKKPKEQLTPTRIKVNSFM